VIMPISREGIQVGQGQIRAGEICLGGVGQRGVDLAFTAAPCLR
jgi:hypothetical protein